MGFRVCAFLLGVPIINKDHCFLMVYNGYQNIVTPTSVPRAPKGSKKWNLPITP